MGHDDEYARREAAHEAYEEEVVERGLEAIKENAIHAYFSYFGDALEARIQSRIAAAERLVQHHFFGESLVDSLTAIELTIRHFLLRPLTEAAFLSEEWADILAERTLSRRTADDRELLPKVLRQWDFDITQLRLSDGSQLWETLQTDLIRKRNAFVHQGSSVDRGAAERALDAARQLLQTAIGIVSKYKIRGKDGWAPESCRRDPLPPSNDTSAQQP